MKTDNNNESFSKADFLNLESFYDDTKYEWYAAKHRKPSPAELSLVNNLSIECCPHCGGTHFKKSGYYSNGTRRYKKTVELDSENNIILLEGAGYGIMKDNIHTLYEYFKGNVSPSSSTDHSDIGCYLPYRFETYGDFVLPLDIEEENENLKNDCKAIYPDIVKEEEEYFEESGICLDDYMVKDDDIWFR